MAFVGSPAAKHIMVSTYCWRKLHPIKVALTHIPDGNPHFCTGMTVYQKDDISQRNISKTVR
jgi:hypothetical protein